MEYARWDSYDFVLYQYLCQALVVARLLPLANDRAQTYGSYGCRRWLARVTHRGFMAPMDAVGGSRTSHAEYAKVPFSTFSLLDSK